MQFFLAFIIIGWVWSIWWGVEIMKKAAINEAGPGKTTTEQAPPNLQSVAVR